MIYFDNAATTFPKPKCVITEVVNCLKLYCGNPGRSSHKLALAASEKIYESREALAKFLSVEKSENIVFTPNATHALNIAIKGLLKENCHYITSDIEHNSVLRPIYKCVKTRNCSFSVYNSDLPLREAIIPLIRDDTRGIITTLASNVTGKIQNIQEISERATEYNLKLIVDASQYLGHKRINLKNINYDVIFGKNRKCVNGVNGWELYRYCTKLNTIIIGGASKLFKYFLKENKPDYIMSFSSNDISNGCLYEFLNFKQTTQSISYWYIKNNKRYHRFSFTKSKLVELGYDKNMSEREIMISNNYYRIYDSGQTRWEWQSMMV